MPTPETVNRPVAIRNEGPIVASLDRGIVRIDSAHLVGPQTDISAKGTVSLLQTQRVELDLAANTNIGLLQNFSRDVYSSGSVVLAASVRGYRDQPSKTVVSNCRTRQLITQASPMDCRMPMA